MSTRAAFVETTKKTPCPACSHIGYCTIASDGSVCICRRGVVSDRPIKDRGCGTAYLHAVTGLSSKTVASLARSAKSPPARLSAAELKSLAKRHRTALSARKLAISAKELGLSELAMTTYGAGWDDEREAISFPMYDGDQKIIGFRLRYAGGKKSCVPGSQNGLFLPIDFDPANPTDNFVDPFSPMLLLTPEGPTDSAAAFDCGFQAVGRPSCSGGATFLTQLLIKCSMHKHRRHVVIIADKDDTHWHMKDNVPTTPYWPGWEGALALALNIWGTCAILKVVKPPKGAKDLRQLVKEATSGERTGLNMMLRNLIEDAPPAGHDWITNQIGLVETWRAGLARAKAAERRKG